MEVTPSKFNFCHTSHPHKYEKEGKYPVLLSEELYYSQLNLIGPMLAEQINQGNLPYHISQDAKSHVH